MARVNQGGTQMWCANCEEVTVCAGLNPSSLGEKSGQRWRKVGHTDVQFFRRGRRCLNCGDEFLTAELQEDFVDELVELRDELSAIKKNVEQYIKDSKKTSKSLDSLTTSLDKLRALNVYKRQK